MDRRDGSVLIVLSLILISPLALPLASSGSTLESSIDMAEKPPENCIPSPRATSTITGNPPVMMGKISMENSNGTTVRIEFSRVSNRAIPDGTLQLRFGEFMNVSQTNGFAKQSDGIYNWDRSSSAWIEYRVQKTFSGPNEIDITNQSNRSGIVPLPSYGGAVQVAFEPTQKGYLGSRFAYLGAYETESIQAGCQEINLIVPENADLISPSDQILTVLNETAYRLPVGRAYEQIRVFVYRGDLGDVQGFVRGREYDVDAGPEIVIQENASFGGPIEFTWRHEYVHTRQGFGLTPELEWFREASANYYAYKTALDSGAITPREYDALLAWSYEQNYSQRLGNHGDSRVAYVWGPLVLSRVDAEMRFSTNQTLIDTFRWMNHVETDSGEISLDQFQNHTLILRTITTSPSPRFNLTQAVSSKHPTKPAYVKGPGGLPGWVRQFWFPSNIHVIELIYLFAGILWLLISGTYIANHLGFRDRL